MNGLTGNHEDEIKVCSNATMMITDDQILVNTTSTRYWNILYLDY